MKKLAFCLVFVLAVTRKSFARRVARYEYVRDANNASMSVLLEPRDDDEFDPSDLSSIVNLAAIGDSYSAGIGAGDRLGSVFDALDSQSDYACSRYNESYPYLVSVDPRFGNTAPNFQFLSCSGAVTKDVLDTQIPAMNPNQNAIMLSIGGNDVELTNILNQCVFQWAVFNWEQVEVAEVASAFDDKYDWAEGYDFEALGRGCAGQLSRSANLIASSDFSNSLDAVLSAAQAKLADGFVLTYASGDSCVVCADGVVQTRGKIYWTGYAKFFAEDLSADCDKVTWATWIHKTYNIFQDAQYLTSTNRQTMNTLVDQINAQMEAAAERAGSDVIFVNYDSYVGYFGGRFCEAGVDESTTDSTTRPGLMFYELNTWDPLGTTPWKRSTAEALNGTFDGEIDVFAQIVSVMDPGAQYADSEANSVMVSENTVIAMVETVADVAEIGIPNLLPDGYGRVFHPQILLHQLIANLVMFNMENVMEISNGLAPLPQNLTISSCPINANTTPPDFYARILPLGASIVWGKGSTSGNGFRKPLRDALRQAGWEVNMVGSKNNGDMIDNNVEATIGDRVDQIQVKSTLSTKYQPNIIVINAGTNDCLQSYDLANFHSRYDSLLDSLYAAVPNVTTIVSTVLPGTADGIPQNRDYVNSQIRTLVNDRQSQGQKIVLVDVDIPAGFFTTQDLVSDGIHPTDKGHLLLAAFYLQAIEEANSLGYITPPAETGISDAAGDPGDTTCDKTFASGESHGAQTQQGSGLDDGIYIHDSISQGVRGYVFADPGANFTFARLQNPFGVHDLLWIKNDLSEGLRIYVYYRNEDAYFTPMNGALFFQDTCIARGVHFVDVNADGLDDMVCIAVNGDTYVSLNRGGWNFTVGGLWKSSEGSPQDRVRLADIDGDGRTDYCTIADNGDISCWRNGGQGDLPEYWQPLGIIFTGKGFGDVNGVRFFDLNGDGRDDWIWMDDTGKTWVYSNNRGCAKGTLEPLWRAGTNAQGGDGYTHAGMGQDVGRSSIYFANIFTGGHFLYGGSQEPYLNPRADYVWIEDTGPPSDDPTIHQYELHVWQNEGSGATKLKSDGDRYCNMLGHANGAMDYIWVHSTGYMILYESFGGAFPAEPPYWGPHYQIWTPDGRYDQAIDRRDLHLADWNGDGLCDIIYVYPDTGEMDVWVNQYNSGGDITQWTLQSNAGPSGDTTPCPEKRGVGIFDLAVRFADIDGNKRADYLCIEPNGRTWGYLNKDDGSLEYISQFKKSEDKDRANLRWVDVNGDGLDDMLWVDKFSGDATVFYNRGLIPASGSAYTWDNQGVVYQGAGQGPCQNWPDLNGDGRADMSFADNLDNTAWTWFNLCPNEGSGNNGDDPDTLTSASLPAID